jgi:hypothetical protein
LNDVVSTYEVALIDVGGVEVGDGLVMSVDELEVVGEGDEIPLEPDVELPFVGTEPEVDGMSLGDASPGSMMSLGDLLPGIHRLLVMTDVFVQSIS